MTIHDEEGRDVQPPPPTRNPGMTDTYPAGYPYISSTLAQQVQQPQQAAHQDQQQQQPHGSGDSTSPPAANPPPQPAGLLGTTSTHGSPEAAAARSVQPHNPFTPEVPPYGTNPYGTPSPLYPAGPTDYPPTWQPPPPPPDGTTWGDPGGGPPPPPGAAAGPYAAATVVGIPVVTVEPGWPYWYDSWWGQDNEERDAAAACCAWTSFVLGFLMPLFWLVAALMPLCVPGRWVRRAAFASAAAAVLYLILGLTLGFAWWGSGSGGM